MEVKRMNEPQLRTWVAKQIRRSDVPENIWEDLCDLSYVEEALDPDYEQQARPELVKRAKALLKRFGNSTGPRRTVHQGSAPQLQKLELARSQAFSTWFGHYVATLPRIRRLREKLLAG